MNPTTKRENTSLRKKRAWHKSYYRMSWERELKNYWLWKLQNQGINDLARMEGKDPYELQSYFMEIDQVFGMTGWKPTV
jgi:hypothetical protein